MKKLYSSALALALVVGASAASASTVPTSFNFTGYGSANDTGSLNVNSADGNIVATLTAPGENLGALNLDGIGVKTGFFDVAAMGDGQLLRVDFNKDINISTVHMRQWEGPDRVILKAYGDSGITTLTLDADSAAFDSDEYFAVSLLDINYITIEGDTFGTQTLLAGLGVSQVPIPAAAYLFGSALFGLVGISRRRKA